MKKENLILLILICILITAFSTVSAAEISEIEIEGLEKSSDNIIKKQLSFSEGENYNEKEIRLSRQRLLNSDLFNPFTLSIKGREIKQNELLIRVNAEESGVFMIHPYEFAIRKATGLFGEKFEQKIRNPSGNGISYHLNFDWSDDSYQEYGLEYAGAEGKKYQFFLKNFDQDLEFNQQQFLAEGDSYKFVLESLPYLNIKNSYSLKYQNNDYSSQGQEEKQEYIIPAYKFNYYGKFNFEANLSRAFSLKDNQKDFNKISLNLNRDFKVSKKARVIADLKGGYSSEETPFNYQFRAGGFSKTDGGLPIRGQEYEFAGSKYLKSTLEYQQQLWQKNLWGTVFLDTAKISASGKDLGDYDWENDGGLGIIYYSFLGPIRADIAFDNLSSDPVFNIGFGSSF